MLESMVMTTMELMYLEFDGKELPLTAQLPVGDTNDDVVARVCEMVEQVEIAESGCIALSTSASF